MNFNLKYTAAEGRNVYGKYNNYRKYKTNPCGDGEWHIYGVNINWRGASTGRYLNPDGSNYAVLMGMGEYIVDEDYIAAYDSLELTPMYPPNIQYPMAYKIVGNKLYFNYEDWGTTEILRTLVQRVDWKFGTQTGTTNITIGSNRGYWAGNNIKMFTTSYNKTDVTLGSGATSIYFIAQAERYKDYTSGARKTYTVTGITNQGGGSLYLTADNGSVAGNSISLPANNTDSEKITYVTIHDDLFPNGDSAVVIIRQAAQNQMATVSPQSAYYTSSGGSESFTVLDPNNHGWTFISTSNWVTMSATAGTGNAVVTATAQPNTTTYQKSTILVFQDRTSTGSTTIPVIQAAQEHHFENEYLTFEIISGGTIKLTCTENIYQKTISYSTDGGSTWNTITSRQQGAPEINVQEGDVVLLKGENDTYNNNTFGRSTAYFNVYGNIMSLIYGDNFRGQSALTTTYTFNELFRASNYTSANIVDASYLILPSTTLTSSCYEQMFEGCKYLISAPTLPATILAERCYESMFQGCSSLVNAPALPAITLAIDCYGDMFLSCTSLVTAPALPATTLADNCYTEMFAYCSSLINAPALPATTLAQSCYAHMFNECTSLTTAPILPAQTLEYRCYEGMFYRCSNLNLIKCLATDISEYNSTAIWVYGVAPTGTFIKPSSMTDWTIGIDGIPTGWVTQDADAQPATVYPTSLSFKSTGETKTITITNYNNIGWGFSDIPSWITLSQDYGATTTSVTVTAAVNTSYDPRSANMVFTSSGQTTTVSLSQEAAAQPASISPAALTFDTTGGTKQLTIIDAGLVGWSLTENAAWMTLSQNAGTGSTTVNVTTTGNESADARSADITFISNGVSTTVGIVQNGTYTPEYPASISPTSRAWDASGGVKTFIVSDNDHAGWTITNIPSWLTLSETYGDGNAEITATAATNTSSARVTVISFNSLGSTTAVTVSQVSGSTGDVYCLPTEYSISESAQGWMLNIYDTENHGWKVETSDSWIGANEEGVGSSGFTVTFYANTGAARNGSITLTDKTTSGTTTIPVYQSAGSAPDYPATIYPVSQQFFAATGETKMFTVTDQSNHGWTLSNTGTSWLTVSPYSGTGSQTVTVTAQANSGQYSRSSILVFQDAAATGSTTIPVYQDANSTPSYDCYFNFTYGDVTVPQDGTWDDYVVYYSEDNMRPVGEGMAMSSFSCGAPLYSGNAWNPSNSNYMSVYSPFSERESMNPYLVNIPSEFLGRTIYLQAEFGSADLGYAIESSVVTVTIPQNGGQVNVTIPAF